MEHIQLLDSKNMIKLIHGFYDEVMRKEIRQAIHNEKELLDVDFESVSLHDNRIAEQLLDLPVDTTELFNLTLMQFADSIDDSIPKITISNLPTTENRRLRDIRNKDIGKLVCFNASVKRRSGVNPQLTHLEYLCTNPDCTYSTERLRLPQTEEKMTTLKACPRCKAPIDIVKKVFSNFQILRVEELVKDLNTAQDKPVRFNIELHNELASKHFDSIHTPGKRISVIGLVETKNIQTRGGADSINFKMFIKAYNVKDLDKEDDLKITNEDTQNMNLLIEGGEVLSTLSNNFTPGIFGNETIKMAIILQSVGGVMKIDKHGKRTRGDQHMLLIGDPGAAKSQMLKAAKNIEPIVISTSGKGTSGPGLIAAAVKDELSGSWTLEAGAMPMASGGKIVMDEMDKMTDEDTSSMHEAMEQQEVNVTKAGIQATLQTETKVLGAANPKYGRIDPNLDLGKQLNFPLPLLSRFDFIFIVRDIPDRKRDLNLARHILASDLDIVEYDKLVSEGIVKEIVEHNFINDIFIKKMISVAKTYTPKLTAESFKLITDFYAKIRNPICDEGETQAIPLTARSIEAVKRTAQAMARINFTNIITKEIAQEAINLHVYCLEQVGIDPVTGRLDVDLTNSGVSHSSRDFLNTLNNVYKKLEIEMKDVKFDIFKEEVMKANDKITEDLFNENIERAITNGLFYRPRKNTIKDL